MTRFRNTYTTLTTFVSAAVLLISTTVPASASPMASDPLSSSTTTAVRAQVTALGANRTYTYVPTNNTSVGDPIVTAYWTPERMNSAIPADTPTSTTEVNRQIDELEQPALADEPVTDGSSPVTAILNAITPQAVTPVTNFSKTNGKVFFRNQTDGKDYVCSGASVNSRSKRLVVTAGHCVHGGPGKDWHTNWIFAPGYSNGATYGTYQAATLRTLNNWINYGESGRGFNSDVAFVTTYSGSTSGDTVVNAVGGHGFRWGGGTGFDVSIFGYPTNLSGGQSMWACWGSSQTGWNGLYKFNHITGCDFGGGSSGGPWLDEYSNTTGLGYVRSVTSNGPADNSYLRGPYFDSRVNDLFVAANKDW